jgi:peptidoglycan/xylan/chitin deacetylase (PgdA/CDA1 family)
MIAPVAGFVGAAVGAIASARWAWWRPIEKGLPILMYHKIGRPPTPSHLPDLWVSTERFRWQMNHLKRRGYTPIGFGDLEAARSGRKNLPAKPVMITFDDGYRNNYELAYPVLRELGMKANLFLVHETVGRHNAWHDPSSEPWLPMLSWAQIREMRSSGTFEFANHTMRHPRLDRIEPEQARWEVSEAKKRLEDALGEGVSAFAYPYGAGAADPRVREEVLRAGHTIDFGVKSRIAAPRWKPDGSLPEALPRLYVRGSDTWLDFRLELSRGRSRAWGS